METQWSVAVRIDKAVKIVKRDMLSCCRIHFLPLCFPPQALFQALGIIGLILGTVYRSRLTWSLHSNRLDSRHENKDVCGQLVG